MTHAYSLGYIAEFLGGTCMGNVDKVINGLAAIETAQAHQLSFVASKQYEALMEHSQAGALIVGNAACAAKFPHTILVANPYLAYAKLSALFETRVDPQAGIALSACVHPSVTLGADVSIGPHCVLEENVVLGDGVRLLAGVFIGAGSCVGAHSIIFPHVVIYHDVAIGERVRIHANTTIGSDGFGFAPSPQGWQKIHQIGGVVIGNNVEIGANTSIDRGALTPTELADGVIIDNQVHIAHNVKIGKNTAIAGCVGIAGSTSIGANCTLAGFVAVNGHVTIADNVHLNGGTVVTKSITEPGQYSSGTIMQEVKQWRRNAVRTTQLDDWVARIKQLEKKLENL